VLRGQEREVVANTGQIWGKVKRDHSFGLITGFQTEPAFSPQNNHQHTSSCALASACARHRTRDCPIERNRFSWTWRPWQAYGRSSPLSARLWVQRNPGRKLVHLAN
jgi:hypothetical protein